MRLYIEDRARIKRKQPRAGRAVLTNHNRIYPPQRFPRVFHSGGKAQQRKRIFGVGAAPGPARKDRCRAAFHRRDDLGIVIGGRWPGPFAFGEQLKRVAGDIQVDCGTGRKRIAAGKGNLTLGTGRGTIKDHKQGLTPVHRHNAPVTGVYRFFGC